MTFKLPDEFTKVFQKAVNLTVTDELVFRCRWPTGRDHEWASNNADQHSSGNASFTQSYYASIIAASLIGINGKPLNEFVEDDNDKELFLKDSLSDSEHSNLCKIKYSEVILPIPADLIKNVFINELNPWIIEQEKKVNLSNVDELDDLLNNEED